MKCAYCKADVACIKTLVVWDDRKVVSHWCEECFDKAVEKGKENKAVSVKFIIVEEISS